MTDWDPNLYLAFEAERTRPALDLLAQVPLREIASAVDLGCGPGNSTALLSSRFAGAAIRGVDNSAAMLERARGHVPGVDFQLADIGDWRPEAAPDLIFSNATLHWLPDHHALLPRLFADLAPGGVLAIQMPNNYDEPSHRLMRETWAQSPWASSESTPKPSVIAPLLPAQRYYDLLADAGTVNIWRTVYYHPMPSAAAIVDWVRGTGLRPFLAPLSDVQQRNYLTRYEAHIAQAYPQQADGNLLLAFPRLFIVAQRRA